MLLLFNELSPLCSKVQSTRGYVSMTCVGHGPGSRPPVESAPEIRRSGLLLALRNGAASMHSDGARSWVLLAQELGIAHCQVKPSKMEWARRLARKRPGQSKRIGTQMLDGRWGLLQNSFRGMCIVRRGASAIAVSWQTSTHGPGARTKARIFGRQWAALHPRRRVVADKSRVRKT